MKKWIVVFVVIIWAGLFCIVYGVATMKIEHRNLPAHVVVTPTTYGYPPDRR